ncbi:SMI1/KNR4 family protein [Brevibacillus sp. IT-7CA2]|uniref:hypothetical protein n=1 Tax=Brevibacillus sp. IT-7CA2 TaxID=3026436 RepID=UPI0039E00A44
MTELLIEKIDKLAEILSDDPFNLSFAEIVKSPTSKQFTNIDCSILKDYYVITNRYEIVNGGVITIFGQGRVNTIRSYEEDMKSIDGDWMCIGKIERNPLFIHKADGQVACLLGDPFDQNYVLESYGDVLNFLENYLLGEQYSEIGLKFVESGGSIGTIGSKDDEWYKVLEEIGYTRRA